MKMSTEYFTSSNSLCSNTFDNCKRREILSGDFKNNDCDNESLMEYSAETSTKASSSSIQESITNMSNSHSTPEDNLSENALSSPFSKLNKIECEKELETTSDQYSKIPNGIFQSIAVSSTNHSSIDDTIDSVLSKIREESDFGISKSSTLMSINTSVSCDKSNVANRPNYSDSSIMNFSAISYHNPINTQSIGTDSDVFNNNSNFSASNFNKAYCQQMYNYGNYYNVPNNFANQIESPNYNRPTGKQNLMYQQYGSSKPYMTNSYINQPYYHQDPHSIPIQSSNYQTFQTPLKRESNYDQINPETNVNQQFSHVIDFKAPQKNTCGLLDKTVRKRHLPVDSAKVSPTKKRKSVNQTMPINNYDDLVKKLKTTNNNSLLMNPSFADSKTLLPPLEFVESKPNLGIIRKPFQYQKYKSLPYFIIKPKHFPDYDQCDIYLRKYLTDTISGTFLSNKSTDNDDTMSDIVCLSPSNCQSQSESILRHLELPDTNDNPGSPQLEFWHKSFSNRSNCHESSAPIKAYTQLTGSFLKRTKINGKSFSNVHIEETVSVASLAASRSQNCCQKCGLCLPVLSNTKSQSSVKAEPQIAEESLFCSVCTTPDYGDTPKILIKTAPYKSTKIYKKNADPELSLKPKVVDESQTKRLLLGVNYCYYGDTKSTNVYDQGGSKEDVHGLLKRYSCAYRLDSLSIDERCCILCRGVGDNIDELCGRLINLDNDNWVHLNCGLWCFDVFETVSGSLVGVQSSVTKAVKTKCSLCQNVGAGIQCYWSKCSAVYHVPCAHRSGCVFYTDRGMYCPMHAVLNHPMQLMSLRVDRRVNVARDECALVANVMLDDVNDVKCRLRVGTLVLNSVGQLLPEQLISGLYNTSSIIYPIGYHSTRIYWSTTITNQRCQYDCYIDNSDGDLGPKFRVVYRDGDCNQETIVVDKSCDQIWKTILNKVAQLRHANGLTRLFPAYLSGEQLYGLMEPHVVRVIESLPGVDMITNYAFKFGRMQLINAMPLAINPSGSARTEPKCRTYVRRVQDKQSSLTNKQNSCGILKTKSSHQLYGIYDSPLFAINKSNNSRIQQYKRLRYEWFDNVILSRSKIQGLGLFAAKDLDKSTMIIEYIGETIRNEIGNLRELFYQSRNNSIYMFRLSDDLIIDATVRGGLARYINHSCAPNCQAEFLSLDGSQGGRIVITTKQRIERGDELTYDYKFDFEDDSSDKIPCLCGAINCRGRMN